MATCNEAKSVPALSPEDIEEIRSIPTNGKIAKSLLYRSRGKNTSGDVPDSLTKLFQASRNEAKFNSHNNVIFKWQPEYVPAEGGINLESNVNTCLIIMEMCNQGTSFCNKALEPNQQDNSSVIPEG